MDVSQRDAGSRRSFLEGVGFLLILAVSTFANWRNAFVTYDFFDMSAFMDAGYRVLIGQEPYVDFFYTAGPIHLYLHALFFRLFGFNQWAVLAHLLFVNTAFVAMAHLIARKYLAVAESLLATAVSSICFYAFIAHPWYDQNAHVWLCAGLLAVEYLAVKSTRPRGLLAAFLCGLAAAFAFFTKANIGLACAALFGLVFLVSSSPAKALFTCAAGALVGSAAVLLTLSDPAALFYNNFLAYNTASRFTNFVFLWKILYRMPYVYLAAVLLIITFLGGRGFLRAERHLFAVTAGLLFASFFTCFTGSMLMYANIPLVGLEILYLMVLCRRLAEQNTRTDRVRIIATVRVLFLCFSYISLFSYLLRVGQYPETWMWRRSNMESNYEMQNGPFRGWRCSARIGPGVDQAVDFINRNVPREESLLIFPDCTVIYGLTGRESYRHSPFIFHLGGFPAGKLYDEFRNHFLREPPRWILVDRQREVPWANVVRLMQWLQIEDFVRSNYEAVAHFGELSLLKAQNLPRDETADGAPRDSGAGPQAGE